MPELPKTLWVGRGSTGIAWYRIVLPAMALGHEFVGVAGDPPDLTFTTGLIQRPMTAEDFLGYDVVVLQQPGGVAWLKFVRRLQAAGVKVLFEIDDYVQAVRKLESHELHRHFDDSWVKDLELVMRVADGVLCSTPWLARRYASLNPRTFVCPNGIDTRRYDWRRPERAAGVTIGWAGSVGHTPAMRPWLPAVARVLEARPEARFLTLGHPFADELAADHGVDPARCASIPFTELESYPASMTLFDLALAPMGNNNLFRGKSDLRWLEASALGIPLVADPNLYTQVEDGVTGLHATTAAEAEAAMLRLVDDAGERERIGAAARAYVREHRTIQAMAPTWAAVLREVASVEAAAA